MNNFSTERNQNVQQRRTDYRVSLFRPPSTIVFVHRVAIWLARIRVDPATLKQSTRSYPFESMGEKRYILRGRGIDRIALGKWERKKERDEAVLLKRDIGNEISSTAARRHSKLEAMCRDIDATSGDSGEAGVANGYVISRIYGHIKPGTLFGCTPIPATFHLTPVYL